MANNMLTVIVPIHDDYLVAGRLAYIKRLLSVVGSAEVILVDDNSSRGVSDSLYSFIEVNGCSNWFLIRNTSYMGIGYSILRGLQFARGTKVAVLPPNVRMTDDSFYRAVNSGGAVGRSTSLGLLNRYTTGFGVYPRGILLNYRSYYYLGSVFWQLNFNALLRKPIRIAVTCTHRSKCSLRSLLMEYIMTKRHIRKLKGVLKNDLRAD